MLGGDDGQQLVTNRQEQTQRTEAFNTRMQGRRSTGNLRQIRWMKMKRTLRVIGDESRDKDKCGELHYSCIQAGERRSRTARKGDQECSESGLWAATVQNEN